MVAIKWFVLVLCLVTNAAAQGYEENKTTIRFILSHFKKEHLIDAIDQKKAILLYGYILQHGSAYRAEVGILLNPGTDSEEFIVVGELNDKLHGQADSSYSYYYSVYYMADKKGYRANVKLSKLRYRGSGFHTPSRAILINLAG